VWEDEPDILTELIEYCLIATPHIAGHSLEGKTRGTFMLYDWLATQTQQAIVHQMADFLPNHDVSLICSDESLTVESLSTLV
jgi:erythronate-4-phosphate dehydrogenase